MTVTYADRVGNIVLSSGESPFTKVGKSDEIVVDQSKAVDANGSNGTVLVLKDTSIKGSRKVSLNLTKSNWRTALTLKHTVKIMENVPAPKMSAKKVTLNKQIAATDQATVTLTVPGNLALEIAKVEMSGTGSDQFKFTYKDGELKIRLKDSSVNKGSYKLTGLVTYDDASSAKITLTVAVADNAKYSMKLKAKGKLDVLDASSEIIYTPSLSGLNGKVLKASLAGDKKNAFRVYVSDGTIHLAQRAYVSAGNKIRAGEKYDLYLQCVLDNGTILTQANGKAPKITVKPAQGKLKLAVSTTQITMYQSVNEMQEDLRIQLTSPANAQIGKVVLTNYRDSFTYDSKNGKLKLKNAANLASGQTYELKLDVYPKSSADIQPISVTVNVRIEK